MKTIWDEYASRIEYDKKHKRCIKHLKTKRLWQEEVECYKKLCEMNPYVVKMYNVINDTTYDMEFIPDILGPVSKYFYNNKCTKQEYIDLFNLVNKGLVLGTNIVGDSIEPDLSLKEVQRRVVWHW